MVKGELIYKNGDEYEGQIGKNNTLEGHGTYKFKDGSVYAGEFKNSQFHGSGKFIDLFQDIKIISQFQNGKANGQGRIIYGGNNKNQKMQSKNTNSEIKGQYEGQIRNGLRHGKGKYIFHNNHDDEIRPISYEGLFVEDSFSGEGKLTFTNNSYYRGSFNQNVYDGHGEYSTPEFLYCGDFKKGVIQGKGIMKYPSGQYYQGQFINSLKDGNGTYHYFDPLTKQQLGHYIGQWSKDMKNGRGKLILKNGDTYQGQFVKDEPYGEFKCNIEGIQIVAQLQGQVLNGPIKFMVPDKFRLTGSYKNGHKQGVFIMQKQNNYGEKVSYRGQFKQGKQVPYSISYSHRF